MAELADAPDLGSGALRRVGSTPSECIGLTKVTEKVILKVLIDNSRRDDDLSKQYSRHETGEQPSMVAVNEARHSG